MFFGFLWASGMSFSWWFVFIMVFFYEYISIKIVYFHLRYYELFLYSKSSRSSLITASKIFHITAPWHHINTHCDVTMNDTKQSCDQVWIFYIRSRKKLDLLHKIHVVGKHGYFTSKTNDYWVSVRQLYIGLDIKRVFATIFVKRLRPITLLFITFFFFFAKERCNVCE